MIGLLYWSLMMVFACKTLSIHQWCRSKKHLLLTNDCRNVSLSFNNHSTGIPRTPTIYSILWVCAKDFFFSIRKYANSARHLSTIDISACVFFSSFSDHRCLPERLYGDLLQCQAWTSATDLLHQWCNACWISMERCNANALYIKYIHRFTMADHHQFWADEDRFLCTRISADNVIHLAQPIWLAGCDQMSLSNTDIYLFCAESINHVIRSNAANRFCRECVLW